MPRKITILTHFPSPYQTELFDRVAASGQADLRVLYVCATVPGRQWSRRGYHHAALELDGPPAVIAEAAAATRDADFFVLNFYTCRIAQHLLANRVKSGKPWAFWGEKPGFIHPLLGRLLRRWKLRALHASNHPIWGIGSWAVAAYRREFGAGHPYLSLPYFSDLSRFLELRPVPASGNFNFLYSGSLIPRKGVDLLARAFARLARTEPRVRLKIMGSGTCESTLRGILSSCADRVEWIGFKDWHELPATYASAHALCVPSRHDGWALVVPEGLASGLPVIGTDRTGAAIDLIKPGENGWIARAGDEESLLESMRQASSLDDERWMEMSRKARESVAHHSLADGAQRFLDAVDAAMAPGGRAAPKII